MARSVIDEIQSRGATCPNQWSFLKLTVYNLRYLSFGRYCDNCRNDLISCWNDVSFQSFELPMPPPTLSLYCHILNLVYHISICIYSICEFIHDYFRIHVEGEKTNELCYHHRLHFAFHFHSLYVVFFAPFFSTWTKTKSMNSNEGHDDTESISTGYNW